MGAWSGRRPHLGEALVIVRGPDAYITPSWYASKVEHGRVVPTWNYVTAQVYGRLVVHDEPVCGWTVTRRPWPRLPRSTLAHTANSPSLDRTSLPEPTCPRGIRRGKWRPPVEPVSGGFDVRDAARNGQPYPLRGYWSGDVDAGAHARPVARLRGPAQLAGELRRALIAPVEQAPPQRVRAQPSPTVTTMVLAPGLAAEVPAYTVKAHAKNSTRRPP